MGLRYGLLAALTLVIASALLWDRLNPPQSNRLFPRDEPAREDIALVVVGGRPEPLPPPGAPGVRPAAGGAEAGNPSWDGDEGAAEEREVVVEKGDTLGAIALRTLGSSRRAADIARHNGFSPEAPIREGQVLRIPPAAPPAPASPVPAGAAPTAAPARSPAPAASETPAARVHRVEKGDTLFALAKRFYGDGGKFRRIADANGLDPDQPLRAGRELSIP